MHKYNKKTDDNLLLCNSSGGGPALAPWPCDVQILPILVDDGVDGTADAEVDGFVMVADGARRPDGFGKRDDAVDISLFTDCSDGVGDGARCCGTSDNPFDSLIFCDFFLFSFKYFVF